MLSQPPERIICLCRSCEQCPTNRFSKCLFVRFSRRQQLNIHEGQGSDEGCHGGISVNDAFLRDKFERAFGAPLLNSDSDDSVGDNTEGRSLWWGAVSLKGKQYELPHGGIGTRFVNMLSEEIERSNNGGQCSEWEFVFTVFVLQRSKMVRKARDIQPLLARRMDMWEAGRRNELLQEARRCDK